MRQPVRLGVKLGETELAVIKDKRNPVRILTGSVAESLMQWHIWIGYLHAQNSSETAG
jgi:hypothetical protein